ncbi:FKBP65 [Acrasis kona]|uniref:FKBP65 n=1 Tax=Acrasis kona TaxID=1008807 RepID=A0AAW2YM65_9EUKA
MTEGNDTSVPEQPEQAQPAPKISRFSGKVQKPKEKFNIPQHDQVEFDAIVEGTDSDGDPIRKKILVQGEGRVPNEGAQVKYIQQGFILCPDPDDESKCIQQQSDINALGKNPQELAFKKKSDQHPLYEKCLFSMKQGEESIFEIPARFRIAGDKEVFMGKLRVPANTPSYYWFRSTKVVRNRLKPENFEERMENANLEKQEGNDSYRKRDFKKASQSYNRARNLILDVGVEEFNDAQNIILRDFKINIVMNLVKSYDQEGRYKLCAEEADRFLEDLYVPNRESMPDLDEPRLILYAAEMLYMRGKVFRLDGTLLKESQDDLEHAIEVLDMEMTLTDELQDLSDRLRQKVLIDLQKSKDKIKSENQMHNLRMKKAFLKTINEKPYEEETQEQRYARIDEEERLAGRSVWFTNGGEIAL